MPNFFWHNPHFWFLTWEDALIYMLYFNPLPTGRALHLGRVSKHSLRYFLPWWSCFCCSSHNTWLNSLFYLWSGYQRQTLKLINNHFQQWNTKSCGDPQTEFEVLFNALRKEYTMCGEIVEVLDSFIVFNVALDVY